MRIPEETIEQIRDQSNIIDVISQYSQLKKKGKNHFAFCPFHEERTPSFSVQEEKQLYHCFSCGRGGNVFSFIMEIEGLSFPEAVIKTAELADISLDASLVDSVHQQRPQEDSEKGKLIAIHEAAVEFYHHILMHTKIGEPALNYLINRGLSRETIETFQIGFAPDQKNLLQQFVEQKDEWEKDLLLKSGLFTERSNEEIFDRFYNRIMFPLNNNQGSPVGFSGRILEERDDVSAPKYLNSPETDLFNKRNLLFNYDKARPTIRKQKETYLFEGFMDVISSHQVGVTNALATMGTSLTEEHLAQLEKITDHIVLSFDGDNAGMEAIKRSAEFISEKTTFTVEVVQFPEKLDPDDYIQKKGMDAYTTFLADGRLTVTGFLMKYHRRNKNLQNDSQRLEYIDVILKEMTNVPSAIEREVYFQQLAEEFDLPLDTLKEQFQLIFMRQKKNQTNQRIERKKQVQAQTQRERVITRQQKTTDSSVERAEKQLLNRLFHFEEARRHVMANYPDFHFYSEDYEMLYMLFNEFSQTNGTDMNAFIEFLNESKLKEKLVEIEWLSFGDDFQLTEIDDCIKMIQKERLLTEMKEKEANIREASKSGDTELQKELLTEIISLNRLLKST